jgi:hypothetical protein
MKELAIYPSHYIDGWCRHTYLKRGEGTKEGYQMAEQTISFADIPKSKHKKICTELAEHAQVSVSIRHLGSGRGMLRIASAFPAEFEKARAWLVTTYGTKVQGI